MRPEDVLGAPQPREEKVWTEEEILRMWPQANDELRGFQRALEARSGLTAAQLGMALQLAAAEFKRLQESRRS